MPRRHYLLASLLFAGVVQAQSVPLPQASDSWSQPASARSVGYRDAAPTSDHSQPSHFKFKERHRIDLPGNAAQERSGRAAVGGMGSMDRSGRPAVSCPQTPMDPACH